MTKLPSLQRQRRRSQNSNSSNNVSSEKSFSKSRALLSLSYSQQQQQQHIPSLPAKEGNHVVSKYSSNQVMNTLNELESRQDDAVLKNNFLYVQEDMQQQESALSSPTTQIQVQCLNLLKVKQYKSCEILALMELSDLNKQKPKKDENYTVLQTLTALAVTLEILGDCYEGMQEYRRAIYYYRRAASQLQSVSTKNRKDRTEYKNIYGVSSLREAKILHKEACCSEKVSDIIEAVTTLESILLHSSFEYHSFEMYMELAKLYVVCGRKKDAVKMFYKVLELNPHVLEAVEQLAQLQSSGNIDDYSNKEIVKEDKTKSLITSPNFNMTGHDLVEAYFRCYKLSSNSMVLPSLWRKLTEIYASHTVFLSNLALAYSNVGDYYNAEQVFQKVRQLDPNLVTNMDHYAQILQNRTALAEINQLASHLLKLDDKRSEPWTCLALYYEMKDHEKALNFIEKAISFQSSSSRNPLGHVVKGRILLHYCNRPDLAAVCFFHANGINRYHVPTYEGLVESYLATNKWREAVCMAREAITLLPKDARAMTLVGISLSFVKGEAVAQGGKDRAKRALKRAISMDPSNSTKPLLALVDILLQDRDYCTCIELIQKAISNVTIDSVAGTNSANYLTIDQHSPPCLAHQDALHAKLADVFQLNDQYMEALSSYHTALSLNPHNKCAQRGLERLDKIMKELDTSHQSHVSHIGSILAPDDIGDSFHHSSSIRIGNSTIY